MLLGGCSAKLTSTRSGYSTAGTGLFAPEMFWRVKLGWGGICEQSSGGGLALGGAVGAKSIMPFPQFGLFQGFPPPCHYSMSPRQNLGHSQLQPLASPQLLCLSPPEEERLLGTELMGAPVQHPATPTTNPLAQEQVPSMFSYMFLRCF